MSDEQTKTVMRIPCEVYSRVVGYIRPVQSWPAGKQQEFADRTVYDVRKTIEEPDKQQ